MFIHCVKNHNFGFSLCYTLSIGEFNREEFLLPHVRTRNLVKRTQLKDVIWLQHHVASFSSSSSSSLDDEDRGIGSIWDLPSSGQQSGHKLWVRQLTHNNKNTSIKQTGVY